jgi:phosphoserine aminotransferase
MAQTYATEVAGLGTTPVTNSNGAVQGGRIRRFRATIALASQADGDTVVLAQVPAGYAFAYGILNASATLGTSTIAVGIAGTAAKYRAAAVFTAAAPTLFGVSTAVDDAPLAAQEVVILTNTTAALPASGTLIVDLYFSAP